jgi:hypothetical protein
MYATVIHISILHTKIQFASKGEEEENEKREPFPIVNDVL